MCVYIFTHTLCMTPVATVGTREEGKEEAEREGEKREAEKGGEACHKGRKGEKSKAGCSDGSNEESRYTYCKGNPTFWPYCVCMMMCE